MKRSCRIATGLLLCSLPLAVPVFATTEATLPPAQTQGVVTYVSGGIGHEEAQAFEAAAAQYPLTLEFALKHSPRAEYVADVHVIITDAHGQRVLDTRSDGPFLLAKLPAGRYTITAEQQQQQALTKTVHVAAHTPTHAMFFWAS